METVLILLVAGAMCCGCFMLGAAVGQRAVRGQEIRLPEVKGPAKVLREHKQETAEKKEQEALATMLYNIDVYDGTEAGQKDLPG